MKEYQERQSRQRKSKADTSIAECRLASGPQKVQLQDHIRVYFPSENTVAASRGGKNVRLSQDNNITVSRQQS